MKIKFPKAINPRSVRFSLFFGVIISWLIKDRVTPLLLNGKSFINRSFFNQVYLIVFFIIITTTFIVIIFSIFNSFYTRNGKFQQAVNKIIFHQNYQPIIQEKINLISTILVVGFTLAVFYHYIEGMYHRQGYPFNTFLFIPQDRFMDFFNNFNISLNPYSQDILGAYFPVSYIILGLFFRFPSDLLFAFIIGFFVLYFLIICIYLGGCLIKYCFLELLMVKRHGGMEHEKKVINRLYGFLN